MKWLSVALAAFFAIAGTILLAWAFAGPFNFIFPVHSPLNPEGIVAVSFVLLVLLCSTPRPRPPAESPHARAIYFIPAIAGVTFAAFAQTINAPLLHDAYRSVWIAAHETPAEVIRALTSPLAQGAFFRPLGDWTYLIDFHWAGYTPWRWHLWSLVLHSINACLVFLLARRLSLSAWPSAVAALVFALHGTRPEAVSWAATRYDLLAAFFVLLTLLSVERCAARPHPLRYATTALFAACALLSKEQAYCLPALVLILAFFSDRKQWRNVVRASLPVFPVFALIFAYRFWLLGGIGGYKTSGRPEILAFSLVRSLKALLFRQWAVLFFPVNWSSGAGLALKCSMLLMILSAAGYMIYSRPQVRPLLGALLLIFAAALPAQHLLLLSQDMNGARVFYLPVLGLALFWGILTQYCRPNSAFLLLPLGLLAFQLTALEHNLRIWREVALLSSRTCASLVPELANDPRPIFVRGLPAQWRGIFFLNNGFAPCVAIQSHQDVDRVQAETDRGVRLPNARVFDWNDGAERLEERPLP